MARRGGIIIYKIVYLLGLIHLVMVVVMMMVQCDDGGQPEELSAWVTSDASIMQPCLQCHLPVITNTNVQDDEHINKPMTFMEFKWLVDENYPHTWHSLPTIVSLGWGTPLWEFPGTGPFSEPPWATLSILSCLKIWKSLQWNGEMQKGWFIGYIVRTYKFTPEI